MDVATLTAIVSGAPAALDPAVVLMVALLLDAVIGDPAWLWRLVPHPVAALGGLIGRLDAKLNRPQRPACDRVLRGAVVTAFVTLLAGAVGAGLHALFARAPYGMAGEALVVAILLAGRGLYDHVGRVAKALRRDGVAGGRRAIRHLVGRDPDALDRHGVARAAIESLAENFADGVLAPAFWYVLFGLPALAAYKAINTLDSMIGYRTERHAAFGLTAARLDDAANYIPARLSGLAICLAAAVVPGCKPGRGLRVMWRDASKHASPNAGWPEAAMAGAMGVAVGGPYKYPGGVKKGAWIGDGRARLEWRDIRRARRLYLATWVLVWLAAAGIALAVIE